MIAYYHHKTGWVEGALSTVAPVAPHDGLGATDGRVVFKAVRPGELRQDATIRATGRIEEPCFSAGHSSPSMVRSYRPPAGTKLLFLNIGRKPTDRKAAFAVEDAEAVVSVFPQAGE